jgi:uncharacterized protein YjbI with pentapeptide repeats
MESANHPSSSGDFSALLDELASIARVRRNVEREFRLIKLSEEAKERYGIEATAYLDLYSKYYAAASQVVLIRTIGNIFYKTLVGAAALGAALSAINLYGFLSDQRGKAIADSWKTIDTYSDKPYDGGRKAAVESLLSYGQVLYHANFNRAPFIYLKAHPTCKVLGLPFGAFGTSAVWRSNDSGLLPKDCIRAELQNVEFRGAKLYGSNFSYANLYQADFSPFTLLGKGLITTQAQSVDFSHANLRASKFQNADLSNSKLNNASLAGAILTNSSLRKTDLRGADLRGADLRGADIRESKLMEVELCKTLVNAKTLGKELLSEIPSSCHEKAIIVKP